MRTIIPELNVNQDKVRILTAIVQRMALNACEWREPGAFDPQHKTGVYTTSAGFSGEKVEIGDLIVCQTSGVHDYAIGFVTKIEKTNGWQHVFIREIGTDRICDMSNESYYVIKGLTPEELDEGLKFQFRQKIRKVFAKYGDDQRRYGGIEFLDDTWANVSVREKFGGMRDSKPFQIKIKWNRKKVSLKTLVNELEVGGWLIREFEVLPKEEQPQGDKIYMTIGNNFVSTMTVKGENDAGRSTCNDEK